MAIIDASLVVAVALRDGRAPAARALLRALLAAGEKLDAPALLQYEVANGLTRAVVAGDLAPTLVPDAWQSVMELPLHYHPIGAAGANVVEIARHLQRQNAYDAAYLALAKDLGTEVWTFDAKLANNAGKLGYPVRLLDAAAA